MRSPDTNHRGWARKAEHDLLNIRNNLRAGRIPWDTDCFHAQQAAEKYLKAFLVHRGARPRRTHDLVLLLDHCVRNEPSLSALLPDCERLTVHAVDARYPGDLDFADATEGKEMVAAARRVRRAILALLPAAPGAARRPRQQPLRFEEQGPRGRRR